MINFKFDEPIEIKRGEDSPPISITNVDVEVQPKWWIRLYQVVDLDGIETCVQPLYESPGVTLYQEQELGWMITRVPRPALTEAEFESLEDQILEAWCESADGISQVEGN